MISLSPTSLLATAGLAGAALLLRAFQSPDSSEEPARRSPSTNGSAALAIADLDTTQQRRTRRVLRIARGWGLLNITIGGLGLLFDKEDGATRSFHTLNLTCGALSAAASQVGLALLRHRPDPSYLTQERLAIADLTAGAAAGGLGALLSTNSTPELRGAGRALLLQSAFIVTLDAAFFARTRSTRRQLEAHLAPIARRLPLEATLH